MRSYTSSLDASSKTQDTTKHQIEQRRKQGGIKGTEKESEMYANKEQRKMFKCEIEDHCVWVKVRVRMWAGLQGETHSSNTQQQVVAESEATVFSSGTALSSQ